MYRYACLLYTLQLYEYIGDDKLLPNYQVLIVITPAYEVCRGVYSFRLSIRSSVHPSSVNILRQFCVNFFFIHQEMVLAGGIRALLGTCSS